LGGGSGSSGGGGGKLFRNRVSRSFTQSQLQEFSESLSMEAGEEAEEEEELVFVRRARPKRSETGMVPFFASTTED
jgi:hypothetical protein